MGNKQYGIDPKQLEKYTSEIKNLYQKGVQIAIVIGGGNIFRGLQGVTEGFDRMQGDYIGMMATVINSMAIQSSLENTGITTKVLSGIEINPLCEKMSGKRAIDYLNAGNIVIIAAGTGNPFFTTDSAAALRAVEIQADVLLKGTRVDGVYSADPEIDSTTVKYDTLSFDEAYKKNLRVMDLTAFTLCKENNIPIIVFNINNKGNLLKVVEGEKIGTIIQCDNAIMR